MFRKVTTAFIVMMMIEMPTALACIGPTKNFEVSFGSDPRGATVTVATDGVGTEILDDTGYVGYSMAYVYLAKQGAKKTIDQTFSPQVNLAVDRLNKFKATVGAAGLTQFNSQIDSMVTILTTYPVDMKKLAEADHALSSALYENGVNVTAYTRPAGTQEWSQQESPVSSLNLPSTAVARSMSCSSDITAFRMNAPASRLPAVEGFTIQSQ